MEMKKTLDALKEAYKASVEENGLGGARSALTKEIGSILLRYLGARASIVLAELQREANPKIGQPSLRKDRRPFIHPKLAGKVQPSTEAPATGAVTTEQPTILGEPLPGSDQPPQNQQYQVSQQQGVAAEANTPIPDVEFMGKAVNTIAQKYPRSRIEATLKAKGIVYAPELSERLLVKLLLDRTKPTKKT